MILVDTSIVIDSLRTRTQKLRTLLQSLPVAICGVTRAEVLQGTRNAAERARALTALNTFLPIATPESIWDEVGLNLARLLSLGLSYPFADAIIASVAISYDIELWTRDQHFVQMQTALPALRLFQEPP